MKLYTEEQLYNTVTAISNYLDDIDLSRAQDRIEKHLKALAPIELPSDEDIEKQSEYISHNYFDMHNTNHYQGLKEGSHRMGHWMKEQILNQNK
jgi:hypothetical protein